MKRPPSCGCGCSCRTTWTPGDNVQREQWLYDAAMKLDNNPIEDALTAPFAIQFDGLPGGPITLDGGPRAFGPTPAGGDPTGWGYFNVNPDSVRFTTKCDWPDMALETIDPLIAIKRADHPYPDVDLHDNPRRGHVPFTFGASQKICQWATGFEHVVHTSDYLVGEIPDAIQNITITFDDMYFRPTDWYVDRVQLFKVYYPIGRLADGSFTIPDREYAPLFAWDVFLYAVYFNSHMGTEAVPITSVPKSECFFTPRQPVWAYSDPTQGVEWPSVTYLNASLAKSDVLQRDNLLPGWKITVPEISGNPHVGRTVEDSIDIYCSIFFDSGYWEVRPAIKLLKCDAQLCHYYSIPVTQNAVLVAPPDNSRIGDEAILPLTSAAVIGSVYFNDTYNTQKRYTTTDPTTGVFVKLRTTNNVFVDTGFIGSIGLMTHGMLALKDDQNTIYQSLIQKTDGSAASPAYMTNYLNSFSSGDIFEIPRRLSSDLHDSNLTFPNSDILSSQLVHIGFQIDYLSWDAVHNTGKHQLPAFLGEQDVTYTFEPHSERIEDRSRDITSLFAQVPNSTIPADGYEHTMTDAEADLYRQAADPVTIPLEVKEITHALDTRVGPPTTVVDAVAVCFHSSWGGTAPNYDYPPHSGTFRTETHSVPGATIVREQY